MNSEAIRRALSLNNTSQVSEATRIAPHILDRIVDGSHLPIPEEIDALAAFFLGEYSMSGTDSSWKRNAPIAPDPERLTQMVSSIDPKTLPHREFSPWTPPSEYPDRPQLKAGPKPSGNGAAPNAEGFNGLGQRVR